MSERDMIFADRYDNNYPDPATVCKGQCEGMGCVPINHDETEEPFASLWREAHTKPHEEPCDGWHFVTCPECNGSGKRADVV